MARGRGQAIWEMFHAVADASVRMRLALAAGLAILAGAVAGVSPLLLTQLIDTLATQHPPARVWIMVFVYVGVLGAGRAVEQAQAYAFATADQRLQRRFGAATFRHLLRLPMRFHLEHQSGGLMQAQAMALQGLRLLITQVGFVLAPAIVQVAIIAIVVASVFDAATWIAVAATTIAYGITFGWGLRQLAAPLTTALTAQVAAIGQRMDGLANLEAVKASVAEERLGARLDRLLAEEEHAWRSCHAVQLSTGLAVATVFVLGIGATLSLGLLALGSDRISVGEFVLLSMYMLQIVRPLETGGFALRDVAQGVAYLARWADIQGMAPEGGARTGAPSVAGPEMRSVTDPAIRFESVTFGYEPDRPVLSDVDFAIRRGAVVAVVGHSGAGKSSLLRLLLGHYAPWRGRILIEGVAADGLDVHLLRLRFAVVSQDVVLFNDTLRYNLMFARPEASAEALDEALAASRLDRLVNRLPLGLDTPVGERGLKLSGGEKQRVAIARALIQDAPVLVLDEATSALDAGTESEISTDLMRAARGRTTLIVTHRLALASHADEILVLSEGHIVERGPHAHLVRLGGSYARLWRRQANAMRREDACRDERTGSDAVDIGVAAARAGNAPDATIFQVQEEANTDHD